MLFTSLTDPVEVARAQAALDAAWREIKPALAEDHQERERLRLGSIIAGLLIVAVDEADLSRRAIERFRQSVRPEMLGG